MLAPTIDIIDAHQFGVPKSGAIYLIRGTSVALVESGTAVSAERTLAILKTLAVTPELIFLTHIHLDHAGGAGHLARAFPKAKVVVHKRGLRHLADPSRLIEGVRSASPALFPHYGEPLPIPEHQLLPVTGGEVFDLGQGVGMEAIATPGHAPHHVCYYERLSRTVFTGDAVGHWNNPVDIPLTVPPRFDLSRSLESLQVLANLAPTHLAFTHFGIADDAVSHLTEYGEQLIRWFEEIRKLQTSLESADIVKHILDRPCYRDLVEVEQSALAMCIRGAILSLETGVA